MGQPKGGGYTQKTTQTKGQGSVLDQVLAGSKQDLSAGQGIANNPLYQQAVQGTQQFLPGGQGFAPIQADAYRQFQQNTIPSIMNAFGSSAKTSSALNQALAGAGQNLNTSLASQMAQMQLGASGQLAGLSQLPFQQGLSAANLGLGTSPFAYLQRSAPFWQDALLAGISGGSKVASSFAGGA